MTTQGVVLALIAQPAVKPDSQPLAETALSGPTNVAMESVMPSVTEDGASLPISAADSSKLPQIDNKVLTAQSTDNKATNPTGAISLPAVDTAMQPVSLPKQEMIPGSQVPSAPEGLRDPQQEQPTSSITPAELSQAELKTETKAESVVLPHVQPLQAPERQDAVKELTALPVQRPEENRPVMIDRPVPAREARESKEDGMPQHLSVLSMAEQDFTNQDREGGMEWSGRDHRDNLSGDQVIARPAMTEISAPAVPSNFSLPVNGADQRTFSSAPSVKLSSDAPHAVTTPSVQPTDWMPGNTTSQTKSMVLELSQADLGRVNIRVAVNQDVVHTHFSSDRNDMGQYLQNGQDRLQSALQTSGLDLGRFQVDIDRQSAGRSFQQPASQGQSSNHSRQEESHNSGQGREEFTQDAMPRRGMLNLVA
ncbi:MAG: flagellar hook-length control protein FliK [Nitrospira sp.]|nr:flagellar hook-length control protein FliK [Nitrospira sp.]